MSISRRTSRELTIGGVKIGGNNPIAIQSMTNTDTHDINALTEQIRALEKRGCEIVRVTVPDKAAVESIYKIKQTDIKIPIIADIHFNYRIAIECVSAGIDKIRINPGNIGAKENVRAVANACNAKNIPIRIGVNSGSLEKHILAKYGAPTAEALAESALYHAGLLEECDFDNIAISVKSSDVVTMIGANRILAEKCDYPLHLGVTEAGGITGGTVKSAIGIGSLLADGIGDTIRVSLTDDPIKEVDAAKRILQSVGAYSKPYYNIVSCPTCGRTKIDLIGIAAKVEKALSELPTPKKNITVAVMGCIVNGPGEAHEADIGIAGAIGEAVLFKHGEICRRVREDEIVNALIDEIIKL